MSSEHDHHDEGGAHEIDKMPFGRLFNLLVGLSALTLLACIGVIQIFNLQVRQITNDYAAEGQKNSALTQYRAEAAQVASGYGVYEFELEGKVEKRYFVPLQQAKKQVLDDAKLLDGAGSYRGWDDSPVGKQIKDWGGMPVAKPAAPADGKAPAVKGEDGKVPAEGKPAEDGKAPAEGKPAEDGKAPAEGDAKEDGDAKADDGDAKADDGDAEEEGDVEGDGEDGEAKKEAPAKRERKGKSGTARPSAGEAKADG